MTQKTDQNARREARLKAALKANMARRKVQSRLRKSSDADARKDTAHAATQKDDT